MLGVLVGLGCWVRLLGWDAGCAWEYERDQEAYVRWSSGSRVEARGDSEGKKKVGRGRMMQSKVGAVLRIGREVQLGVLQAVEVSQAVGVSQAAEAAKEIVCGAGQTDADGSAVIQAG
jgi:hypothetical protein